MDINQILDMGGYGVYVWSAYIITLSVFGINLHHSLKEKRKTKKIISQYLTYVKSNIVKNYES